MTREEAIYCMKSYIDNPNYEHCISCPYYGANQIGENVFVCNSSEAHKMAVEALEQEPCEDCISRADAIEFFKDDDYVVNELKNLAPVTPAEKVGHWEYKQYDIAFPEIGNYHCSSCDAVGKNGDNYCSVCGAKMEVEE